MKLIDFDEKFNRKISKLMEKHMGEHSEEEWEDIIAKEYSRYGDTYIAAIEKTPRQFFAEMADEQLVEYLKEYILQEIAVPDFLCEEIEHRGTSDAILSLLDEQDEELVQYALNLIGSDAKAAQRYTKMLANPDFCEHIKDTVSDNLKPNADLVKDEILALVKTENKPYALEILSKCQQRDDRVYNALEQAFRTADFEELPLYANYLANYGDERALTILRENIERDDIDFVVFQELKYAIEALGGEYNEIRDFSDDAAFQKVKAAGAEAEDIFGIKNFS